MIELSRFTVIIVGETLLGFFLLSSFLIGYGVIKRIRIRKASRHLVGRIEGDKTQRTNRLRSRLEEYYGYAGETLEQAVHDLTQAELRLYQNVINSYLKQDVIAFQQSDVDVENLVIAYQQLNLQQRGGEAEQQGETSGEIKRLEEENGRLSEELRVTMDTMGHMLNEYSSMFEMNLQAKGGEPPPASLQNEVVTQADSVPEQESTDNEGIDSIPEQDGPGVKSIGAETGGPLADVVATGTELGSEFDSLYPEGDEDIPVADSVSADPGLKEGDSMDGIQQSNEGLLEKAGELGQVKESVADLTQRQASLMDELESVDIDLPDAQVQLAESESPAGESLEEEWARLLEEDADCAESSVPRH